MKELHSTKPHRNRFIYFSILCFIGIAVYIHTASLLKPFIGVIVKQDQRGSWIVTHIIPDKKGESWGIKQGDHIQSLGDRYQLEYLESHQEYMLLKANNIIVEKQDGRQEYIPVQSSRSDLFQMAFFLIMELALLGIGMYAVRTKPTSRVMRQFCLLNLVMAMYILAASTSQITISNYMNSFCSIWLPYLLLSFYLFFVFRTIHNKFQKLLLAYQIYSVTLTVLNLFLFASQAEWLADLANFILILTLLLLPILTFLYWKRFEREEKNQLLLLSGGIFLSLLPYVFLYALPTILLSSYFVSIEYTLIGFIPLSVTIMSILMQRSMLDMRLYLPRLLIHSLFIISVFILFALVVKFPSVFYMFLSFSAFLLLTYGYQKSLTLFRHKTEQRSEWLEQQQLRMSIQVAKKQNIRDMMHLFAEMIHSMIDIEGLCLIWNDGELLFIYGTGKFKQMEQLKDKELVWNRQKLENDYDFYRVMELSEDIDKPAGYLCVGYKKNKALFTVEENKILDKGCTKAIQMIMNAKLLSRLQREYERNKDQLIQHEHQISNFRKYGRQLLETQESERIRTSYYLHDHLLQNLIFLSRDLEELHDTGEAEKERIALWLKCLYDSQRGIRSLCNDLYPPIIDKGNLKDALQWLLRTMQKKSGIEMVLHYDLADNEPEHELIKTNLFRAVRELLQNVLKHSGASHVSIHLWVKQDKLFCKLKDNGQGFDVISVFHDIPQEKKQFGLISVHNQIRHLSGHMDIESSSGKGTTVTIEIPVFKEEQSVERVY